MPGRGTPPGAVLYRECGTREGALRHRREKTRNCAPCREVNRQDMARYRVQRIVGGRRMVPTLGTRRRVQALARRGWRQADVGARVGMSGQALAKVIQQAEMHRDTAGKVAVAYRRLLDQDGPSALLRQRAERWGWPGPMDWDDPDDPGEVPACVIEAAHREAKEMYRIWRKNQVRRLDRQRGANPGQQAAARAREAGATNRQKAAMTA